MFKKILIVIAIIIAGVLVVAAMQPDDYRVERSVVINATPDKVFPYINKPKNSSIWSPWKDLDPNTEMTYEGPEEGTGSKSAWDGNDDIGAGVSEIIESRSNEYVKVKLNFTRPMVSEAFSDYTITSEGAGSKITWAMYGKNTFPGRIICIFMNMDKMLGATFEKGLNSLKKVVEEQK